MTISQLSRQSIDRLSDIYETSEARWIMRITLEHLTGWTQADILLNADREASADLCKKIDNIISRLHRHEPIQYILGTTYWHGINLKVTPDVLIPRQETSELVDMVEQDFDGKSDLNVLDICTGSGCIAIALARALPFSSVTATDISIAALEVARDNAQSNKVKVDFITADALAPSTLPHSTFDIIVSNPPYIARSEEKLMDANVLDYEPHSALFVPDDNPLKFYRPISANAMLLAKPGAKLYLEVNPLYSNGLRDLLQNDGWNDVNILKDIHGKDRFATAQK